MNTHEHHRNTSEHFIKKTYEKRRMNFVGKLQKQEHSNTFTNTCYNTNPYTTFKNTNFSTNVNYNFYTPLQTFQSLTTT